MDSILEVNGLVKRYPAFFLDNISFSLPEGCVLGFIGANGAGKTTTIRSILNLAHKDAGTIKIFGLDTVKHEQEIKDRIGIVMDGSYFYNELSIPPMADKRKYYYLKLKESYFDDDAIVLLESMPDGILYSNILLKLYLKSLKNGGKLQLDEHIPYTAQMIATLTRRQIGTVERALEIFRQLGLWSSLTAGLSI